MMAIDKKYIEALNIAKSRFKGEGYFESAFELFERKGVEPGLIIEALEEIELLLRNVYAIKGEDKADLKDDMIGDIDEEDN